MSPAVPYAGAGHDATRAAGVRAQRSRAIARRPRPARWLPRPRATGATRRSKTLHLTSVVRSGPRSIGPPTVDPRSRRPLTELCCPPAPPVIRCVLCLVKQTRCRRRFPLSKRGRVLGAWCRPCLATPVRIGSPPSRRNTRNSFDFVRVSCWRCRNACRNRGTTAPSERRSSAKLGDILDAAPHAGLGWARYAKPDMILHTNSQRTVR